MPEGNYIGESGFYVIFHDVAVGGSFNLFLPFFSPSDFKCVISLHEEVQKSRKFARKSAKITKICTKKMHPDMPEL